MKISNGNGSYMIFDIKEDSIDLELIKSNKKGDGTKLINQLKDIARENGLSIELISIPQDDTISQEQLNAFYEKNGFELHPDDVDHTYYIWK